MYKEERPRCDHHKRLEQSTFEVLEAQQALRLVSIDDQTLIMVDKRDKIIKSKSKNLTNISDVSMSIY